MSNIGFLIVGGVRAAAMKRRTTRWRWSSSSPFSHRHDHGRHCRSLAIMVMGHGWTGALGTGRLDQYIAGHDDNGEDDFLHDDDNNMLPVKMIYNVNNTTNTTTEQQPGGAHMIRMVRPGWGHTAVITHNHNVLLTGRAHDFQNLLRLHRMPEWLRNQIAKSQQQSSSSSQSSSSRSYLDRLVNLFLQNFGASGGESSPATRSSSSNHSQHHQTAMMRDWQVAADMSLLTTLTEIKNVDEPIVAVACSAGLTALVTSSGNSNGENNGNSNGNGGFVYTFGVNSFGQCGVGFISNNVWQPTRVVTTSRQKAVSPRKHHHHHHQLLKETTTSTTTNQIGDDRNDCIDNSKNNSSSNSSIVNNSPSSSSSSSSSSPMTVYDQVNVDNDIMQDTREQEEEQYYYLRNITSVALGLQHGVCLNESGQVFCFGKGDRGQLGLGKFLPFSPTAQLVQQYCILQQQQQQQQPLPNQDDDDDDRYDYNNENSYNPNNKPIYKPLGPVQQVAAGLLHTAALTHDNQVLIWGKNVLPPLPGIDANSGKVASDANVPCQLHLPNNHDDDAKRRVLQIACGSHHTAMLLEDGSVYGVGLSSSSHGGTSQKVPIFEPVLLIPPGLVEMPVRQFAAHMDRTTIVGASGQQVLQVQLQTMPKSSSPEIDDDDDDNNINGTASSSSSSSTSKLLWGDDAAGAESLSSSSSGNVSYFTPAWVNRLLEHDPNVRVQEVHRGWLHTVIVTDDHNDNDETNKNVKS